MIASSFNDAANERLIEGERFAVDPERSTRVSAVIETMQVRRLRPRLLTRAEQVPLHVREHSDERWLQEDRQLRAMAAYDARPGWLRRFFQVIGRIW